MFNLEWWDEGWESFNGFFFLRLSVYVVVKIREYKKLLTI